MAAAKRPLRQAGRPKFTLWLQGCQGKVHPFLTEKTGFYLSGTKNAWYRFILIVLLADDT
jgi:hypothetical protein